ncbi:MAG: 4Fe-4S dicluster domain-containing protein [Pseudomonadota bacterium]
MKWTDEAEAVIKKVPFFVRKRVRARVEKEAAQEGKQIITPTDITATQTRYLSSMEKEVRGWQVEGCFGPAGCPNRAVNDSAALSAAIETVCREADLLGFLKQTVAGPLKFHHEFRISLADCPNACSQPQIKDIGIIGAAHPVITEIPCSDCGACLSSCREDAVTLKDAVPVIDPVRCMACGGCMAACPTGSLAVGASGYRIQVGGKLGRHPRLARELPGIYTAEQTVAVVKACIALYKARSTGGQRFGELLTPEDLTQLSAAGKAAPES